MNLNPLAPVFELGQSIIERIWPDANKRAEEMTKLEALRQEGNLEKLKAHVQLLTSQMEINKTEASHPSVFVAGWRPFIGWVGGSALAYAGIIHPLLVWCWTLCQSVGWLPMDTPPPPYVTSGLLGTIVTGMLGIGTMRSFDKSKQVDTREVR